MLPDRLRPLHRLAYNLWWSWDEDASQLFADIDPWLWETSRHNPAALLVDVDASRWGELAEDSSFLARLDRVVTAFDEYLATPWQTDCPTVAYFSMEFGLHESLRIYSGGLGVLAGDHIRSCSDLAVPLIGVSLLYRQGYFRQVLDEGRQTEAYPGMRRGHAPIGQCITPDGNPLRVGVRYENAVIWVTAHRLNVGRTYLYLLDTDLDENPDRFRDLTKNLYGGDHQTRIAQEVVLALGGLAVLKAMEEPITAYHLNEGHCAFVQLGRIAQLLRAGRTLDEAIDEIRPNTSFTTHTPVPAGHDRFSWDEFNGALGPWRAGLGVERGAFMDLGRERPGDWNETLCMTVLGMRTSAATNGVSRLHGRVSREMFRGMWPDVPVNDVPIGHITNGVHPIFWTSDVARKLWDEFCPGWRERPWDDGIWEGVERVPDERLWAMRNQLRVRLVDYLSQKSGMKLDPEALTIGFARRFAPYKRGDLIFTDPDRLAKIVEGGRPVQFVFAGKAHPRDVHGKEIVERVLRWSDAYRFRNRVAFVEDYDIHTGRLLTSGSDVWLNNPRRPNEASGTSGQKGPFNGGLNFSTLDGWWPEAYDDTNGWAIGDGREDTETIDDVDVESMYRLLEEEIVPLWSARDAHGIPAGWLARVRRSVRTCAPVFNSHRMVRDYVHRMYRSPSTT